MLPRWWWRGGALLVLLGGALAAAQNARIVLRWKDVPGASAYELQIARDPAFVEVVLQTRTTTAGYRWEQLPTTTHWWRVRSFDAESRPSEWSQPRTLAVDSAVPTPKRPADGAGLPCGATVEFELEPSPLVKEYLVELSASAEFSGLRTLRSADPALQVPGLATGTWWWRTRAVDIKGRTSGPGPVRSFSIRVAAPKPKTVADVLLGTPQVTLAWASVGCAASYLVEATVDGKDRVSIPAAATQAIFKAGVAGEYRWRVAGVDERGGPGEFSPESVFRVRLQAPQLKAESPGADVQLAWSSVPTATSYKVELQRLGGKAPQPVATPTLKETSWRAPELSPGRYRWRVTARDAQGHASLPSEFREFDRAAGEPLATPRFLAPRADAALAVGAEADLSWSPVPEATRYEVELDDEVLQLVQSPTLRTAPLAEGLHRLRVRALGERFRVSAWSGVLLLFAGTPAVARAEVEQQGDLVLVRLLDVRGLPVRDAQPRFTVREGRVGAPEVRDGRWQLPWDAPSTGRDVLTVEERAFSAEFPLVAVVARPFSIAARGGGVFNGSAVASPSALLAFTARAPWFGRRLGAELRVGFHLVATGREVGTERPSTRAVLLPLSLLLAWHQDLGPLQLKLGVGPALTPAWIAAVGGQEVRFSPGGEAVLGLSRRFGPGRVELEVGYLHAPFATPLATFNGGGVGARLGYVLDLGGEF